MCVTGEDFAAGPRASLLWRSGRSLLRPWLQDDPRGGDTAPELRLVEHEGVDCGFQYRVHAGRKIPAERLPVEDALRPGDRQDVHSDDRRLDGAGARTAEGMVEQWGEDCLATRGDALCLCLAAGEALHYGERRPGLTGAGELAGTELIGADGRSRSGRKSSWTWDLTGSERGAEQGSGGGYPFQVQARGGHPGGEEATLPWAGPPRNWVPPGPPISVASVNEVA
jgi:hypothetical protein